MALGKVWLDITPQPLAQARATACKLYQPPPSDNHLRLNDLNILTTNKSAAIRAELPVVDRFGELAPQIDKARADLLAASRLIELSHQLQL